MSDESSHTNLLELTTQIVAAHVAHNPVEPEALPDLIKSVFATLSHTGAPGPEPEILQPAVPIKKSVFPDYLICLEDGKKLKMLKRHLSTSYDMTPEEYRARWNLPSDYPMVAPNYAAVRSTLAKSFGLGRKPASVTADEPKQVKPGRGRKKAA